jgi:hypothetical protein
MMNAQNLETTEKTPSIVVIIQEVAHDIRTGGTQMVPGPEMAKMMGSIVIVQDTLKTQDVEMEERKGSITIGPGIVERKVQGTGKERMGDIQKAVQGIVIVQDTQKAQDTLKAVILKHQGTALEDQESTVVEEMEMVGTLSLHVIEMTIIDIMVEEAPDIVGKTAVDMIKARVTNMGEMIQ